MDDEYHHDVTVTDGGPCFGCGEQTCLFTTYFPVFLEELAANVDGWNELTSEEKGAHMYQKWINFYAHEGVSDEFEPAFPMDLFCVLSGLYNEWPIRCESCLEQPCVVVQSKDFFIEAATKKLLENTSNKQVRFFLYRMFSQKINGYLGAKTRRRLPECVMEFIRHYFPDPDGIYVGYKGLPDG